MKVNWIKIIAFIVIAFLVFVFFFDRCGNQEGTTVKTPEIEGNFEEQEPIYIPTIDTVYVDRWETVTDTIEIEVKNKVNDSLALAYKSAKDSLERYKLFRNAIQIRTFKNTFEDEYLKLSLTGRVQGHLLGITPNYTIKPREIEVEGVSLRFLVGGGIGNNLGFNDFTYRVNLGVQNGSGNIARMSYSRMRGQDYVFIDYDISLFEFR